MIIKRIVFNEGVKSKNYWSISETKFGIINLVTGKNSSGKSRLIKVIFSLAHLLSGKVKQSFSSGNWSVDFEVSKGKKTHVQSYALEIKNGIIQSETLFIDGVRHLTRGPDGSGQVLTKTTRKSLAYKVDTDQVMVLAKRDKIQHPFLEDIFNWAKTTCLYEFGSDFGHSTLAILDDNSSISNMDKISYMSKDPVRVFHEALKKFGDEYKRKVISAINEIEYQCDDISLEQVTHSDMGGIGFSGQSGKAFLLQLKEKDLFQYTSQAYMSQGMYRAVVMIIHIYANILFAKSKKVGRELSSGDTPLILIDDIGEGLDFNRSKKLIQLLVKEAEENLMQIIMTSNDRFIMNAIDLKYLTVLSRSGGDVSSINIFNSKEEFEDFSFSGLNNFDFFSSKY